MDIITREYKILGDVEERETKTDRHHFVVSKRCAYCVETQDFIVIELITFPSGHEKLSPFSKRRKDRMRAEFMDLQTGDYLKAEVIPVEFKGYTPKHEVVSLACILEVGNFDYKFREVK